MKLGYDKVIFGTTINDSATIAEVAGADIENGAGKAVKYDDNGNVVLAGGGELIAGVLLVQERTPVEKGDSVTVQIRYSAKVLAGGPVKKGEAVAVSADGTFVKATSGQYIAGYAITPASEAKKYFVIDLVRGAKA